MVDDRSARVSAADSAAPLGSPTVSSTALPEQPFTRDQLRTILDTIPTLAWAATPDGVAEFLNRRWLEYTGLSVSDALAGQWIETVRSQDRDALVQALRASGESFEIEIRQRRFDGEYRWFLVRASALRDASGGVLRWYGTNTDIEDWHCAKESILASERHLQLILDSLPALVYTQTPDGTIEYCSKRILEYFGVSTIEEQRDWAARGMVHPDDRERAFREIAAGIASGEPYGLDVRLRRFDNTFRWFQCRHIPLRDADGRIARWYGLGADIDDFERKATALRESEQSWRLIVDSIPGLVFTMTPGCDLEFVNRKVLDYFGRTFEELKAWDRIGAVHPDDLPVVRESLRRTVEHGEPHEVEQRLKRSDGVYRWFKPRALSLRDADGRIVRWYCLLTDVDDLRRAEESLRNTQESLNRAARLATVSELSAAIAHEINQPLAAVVTNGHACRQWLSGSAPNIERAIRSADLIVRDGNAAAQVIQRMRSLFKHEPLAPEDALPLNGVIEEVCTLMADHLRQHGVHVKKDLAAMPLHVRADRVQLQQVLTNLLSNGIDSMIGVLDRPRLLTVSSKRAEDEVHVLITDQGVGMGDPNAVFESFYSTKSHGLGMGLSICRTIIGAHGGRLWAVRNTPHGSTFGFALPMGGTSLRATRPPRERS